MFAWPITPVQVLQIVITVDNPRASALANVRALMGSETSRLSTPAPLHPTSVSSSSSRPNCAATLRSEEHTSELQSRLHLVCRLLLEKKKNKHLTLVML